MSTDSFGTFLKTTEELDGSPERGWVVFEDTVKEADIYPKVIYNEQSSMVWVEVVDGTNRYRLMRDKKTEVFRTKKDALFNLMTTLCVQRDSLNHKIERVRKEYQKC